MRAAVVVLGLAGAILPSSGSGLAQELDRTAASHFAALALRCASQEYPNKLDHVMNGPAEVQGPKALHPAFYGCFDWHSSVHGHWLMVRLLRTFPDLLEAAPIRAVLDAHLAPGPIAAEVAYLKQDSRASFERTYGWAWLLKLSAELKAWDSPEARRWEAALRPLTEALAAQARTFLWKQTYPIRTGVHPNTAFSLSLMLDYADAHQDTALRDELRERALHYFQADRRAPLAWEPGGEDFLSPCLEEAALMVRLLPPDKRVPWLKAFLPDLLQGGALALTPAIVSDRTDPKIVHLDGLNLSRARCLYQLSAVFPKGNPTRKHLRHLAEIHAQASLPHIATGAYEGEHWLGTFALHMFESAGRNE